MADPLSIAASILGLVAFVSKVVELAVSVHGHIPDGSVKQEMASFKQELKAFNGVLGRLEDLIRVDERGAKSVFVGSDGLGSDIETMLQDCMSVFKELEVLLQSIISSGSSKLSKLRWINKSKEIAKLRQSLETRKATLNITLLLVLKWGFHPLC